MNSFVVVELEQKISEIILFLIFFFLFLFFVALSGHVTLTPLVSFLFLIYSLPCLCDLNLNLWWWTSFVALRSLGARSIPPLASVFFDVTTTFDFVGNIAQNYPSPKTSPMPLLDSGSVNLVFMSPLLQVSAAFLLYRGYFH